MGHLSLGCRVMCEGAPSDVNGRAVFSFTLALSRWERGFYAGRGSVIPRPAAVYARLRLHRQTPKAATGKIQTGLNATAQINPRTP